MTTPVELPPIIGVPLAVLVSLGGLYAVIAGGLKARREARALGQPPPTPYEALAARVVALEQADSAKTARLDILDRSVRRLAGVLTREVAAVLTWIAGGSRPPAPDAEIAVIRAVITDLEGDRADAPTPPKEGTP